MLYRHPDFPYEYIRPKAIKQAWLAKKGHFKKLACYGAGVFILVSLAAINVLVLPKAKATFAFNATNNLGQDHGSFTTPNYSDYFENDTPPGNHVGYDDNSDVTIDTVRHRMFVADANNMRVMVYNLDSSNHFTSTAADFAIGQPDFANSNLPYTFSDCFFGFNGVVAAQNNFCQPGTLAFDSTNNRLFVSDGHWNRVLVYDLSGGISNNMNASWVLGQPDFTSSSCPGTPTQSSLCAVGGMFYDSANQRLFVSDTNSSRIMVYDLSGGISNGMNAAHVLGQTDFVTGTADTSQSGLNRPTALTYDNANSRLFVGDDSNQRVMIFNLGSGITDGMNASNVLGQTDFTSSGCASPITQSSICDTGGLAYDSVNSRLSISDTFKYRVLTYNLSGGISDGMNASYEFGQADFVTFSGHPTAQNSVSLPGGLAYVGQELLVSDTGSSRLLTFDMSGTITNNMNASHEEGQADYLGNSSYTFGSTDNANPSPYGFSNGVNGMAEDTVHHRLYVGDFDNNRVLVYDLDANNHLTGRGADHVLGVANFTTVNSQSSGAACANSTTTCQPIALAADSAGNRLFVANYFDSRVMVFDFSGGISNGMAASHVIGQPNFTTVGEHCSPSTGQNNLCDPAGLAYDSNHKILYVSEEGNSRVMSFNADPSTMTDGENALHVLGQANFTSSACDGGGVTDHTMCSPEGITYDNADNWLFVTEDDNNRVLQFDMSGTITNGMSAAHVIGQANFTSSACNNGGRNAHTVCDPFGGVAYDSVSKRLFLPDTGNARVLEFNLAGGISNGMSAINVYGTSDSQNFGAKGPGCSITTAYSMCDPQDLVYDQTSGKLYAPTVTDNRILVFNAGLAITTTSLPDSITGSVYSQTINVTDSSGSTAFSVSAGALPPGLSLNSSTGDITGTPTTTGTYNFTIQATDSLSEIATQAYTVNIGADYQASDLLGQVDGGGNPIWDNGNINNSSGSVNDKGFNGPFGTTMDTVHHRLFVADFSNSRVLVFNLDSNNNLIDRTADNVLGQSDFTSGGDFANCQFNGGTPSASNMCEPISPAYDPNHNRLFVPDVQDNRVLVFDLSGGITNGMAASWVLGEPDFSTVSCTTTQSTICSPYGGSLYDASTDRLYVGDSSNARVLVFDLSSSIASGMNASFVIGQTDFLTADSSSTTQSSVGYPEGLALDSANHRLFVADWNFAGRVMVFDTSALANGMNAAHELGEADFTSSNSASDNGDPPDAKSFGPVGLAYDPNHQILFVEDDNVSRIMLFDVSSIVDGEDAIGVLGQPSLTTDNGCGTSQGELCFPESSAAYYDTANNRLYTTDYSNSRVMIFGFAKLGSPAPDGTVGSAYSYATNTYSQGTTTFTLASGGLPNGVNLNGSTGDLTGTPTTVGTFNFSLHMADDNGPPGTFTDDHSYSVNIASAGDSQPPTVPTGLQVTGHTSSTISLAWNASSDNVGVTGYHIFRDGVQVGSPSGTTFTDTGLTSATTYNYTVSAFDAASNESAQSSPAVPGTTDDNIPPSTPANLQVTGTTPTSITLAWDPSTDNLGVSGYNIYRDGGLTPIAVVGGTGFTDTGLTPATSYSYTVTAFDAANNESGHSNVANGTTDDNVPPSVPTGLHVTGHTSSSISLSWNASSDNVGVTGYNIYRNGGGTPVGSTASTSFADSGLPAGTTYSYTVTAFDAAANESGHSSPVSAATDSNGGGGSSGGGSSGGGASSSGGSASSGSSSSSPTPPAPINLDEQPDFTSGDGYTTTAVPGQKFTFTDSSGGNNDITVSQILADSTIMVVDGDSVTVATGQPDQRDVNNDNKPDININLDSTDNGIATLTFKKIVQAAAPGGITKNNGFGGGTTNGSAAASHSNPFKALLRHIPQILLLNFPWLLFILLGLSFGRLTYLSYQERRLVAKLARQLKQEKALAEEKNNFVTLTSHYLRTPLTLITNGIDLLTSLGGAANPSEVDKLRGLSRQLNEQANAMLAMANSGPQAGPGDTATEKPVTAVSPSLGDLKSSAGFIRVSSMGGLSLTVIGAFALIALTNFILRYVDLYNISQTRLLTELAGILLAGILLIGSLRSYHKQQELRRQTEILLNQRRQLESDRDRLVRESLERLKPLLDELKRNFQTTASANPQAAKPALNGVGQLDGLLKKFTILASLEAGKLGVIRQPLEINQLTGQIAGRYAAVLQTKNLNLSNQVQPARLSQDPLLVSFVIDSVLNNAIKYSPQGGQISLHSRSSGNQVEIAVQDNGPGIDAQKQAQLFQPFSRAENTAQDFDVQGAGLSLYLDKMILSYLDGDIKIDSQPGRGTTVTLNLPA